MKIAMFGHKRIPSREGGVEIVVEELSTRMAARGHDVTCYNRMGRHIGGAEHVSGGENVCPGVKIRRVPTIDRKGLAAVSSSFFAAIVCAFSAADVVHIHAEGPAFMCWLPRLFGKRVVVTIHGLDWQRQKWSGGFGAKFIHWGEKMAVRFAHEIIVLSENVRDYFLETYGRETVHIPNGVVWPELRPAEEITRQYGLEKDGYILFLGRLVPEKGVHYLIQAFRDVQTDKKLVIAGSPSDSSGYGRELETLAKGDERILFTGFVQGRVLEELYSNAWIYVLPSDLEGMPLSLLEAMSYGCCCLVSDIPECAQVVGDHGVIFPKGDITELTEQLQSLSRDDTERETLRAGAADYVTGKYSWDETVQRTLELYRGKER